MKPDRGWRLHVDVAKQPHRPVLVGLVQQHADRHDLGGGGAEIGGGDPERAVALHRPFDGGPELRMALGADALVGGRVLDAFSRDAGLL